MSQDAVVNLAIAGSVLAIIAAWVAIEAYCAWKGIPTISERLKAAGKTATILPIAVSLAIGLLIGHFWAGA